MNISEALAVKLDTISYKDFPTSVINAAKSAFQDTIAVAIAGATTQNVDTALAALNPSPGATTIWCKNRTTNALDAAFVNTTASHALDFDDCTTSIGGHPSVPLIAPIIALAEEIGASGSQVIEAYVAGYEIMSRLGDMVMPEHYTIGWHPTATMGVFGATAACSKLLGLSQDQMKSALAIVPSFAAGTKANFGTQMKPLQVGAAARNGLLATKLAATGCDAMLDSIDGDKGFFKLFNNGISHPLADDSISETQWRILNPGSAIKQHPCCGSTHSAIDAAIELYHKYGAINPDKINQVTVRAHPRRLGHTFKPNPTSGLEAKFSIQFVVAVALAKGSLCLSDFKEPFDDSLYTPFKAKLEVVPTEFDDEFKSTVEMRVDDNVWSASQSTKLGRGIDRPMSLEERDAKFADCIGKNYPKSQVSGLRDKLRTLERLDSITDLTEHLQ